MLILLVVQAASTVAAPPSYGPPPVDPMQQMLQQMVADDPGRGDCWRMLGKLYRRQNRIDDAIAAHGKALEIQPDNVAAHADLGDLWAELGQRQGADYHYDRVMQLAPDSHYADRLVERGVRTRPPEQWQASPALPMMLHPPATMPAAWNSPSSARTGNQGDVDLVGYEIQTFDGADDLERRLRELDLEFTAPDRRWQVFLEFGSLYNTNVTLAPISRELTGSEEASFQGFFNPDIQWIATSHGPWRMGPLLRGYFTLNEGDHRSLDLASFQPGLFVERDLPSDNENEFIGRLEYVYSLDLFGGSTFGDRHGLTASLSTILPEGDVIYSYFNANYTDFANDGPTPAIDSLDGLALATGVSRFFNTGWQRVPTWSLGSDVEWANTRGADYRFLAVALYANTTFQLVPKLSFTPRMGVGYRYYGDFTGPVDRNELNWRASGRLQWQWTDTLSIAAVVGHDRFASDNQAFDSQRTEAGIVFTVVY